MLLYNAQVSGNYYKVRLLLAHLGVDYDRREIDVIDRSGRSDLLGEVNPALQVPTLVLDDGRPFVPGDQEWADDVVWSNLAQGLATVVVNEESELVLLPRRRSLLDKLRGRVAVTVGQRVNGHAPAYMTPSRLGRHPLREIREF